MSYCRSQQYACVLLVFCSVVTISVNPSVLYLYWFLSGCFSVAPFPFCRPSQRDATRSWHCPYSPRLSFPRNDVLPLHHQVSSITIVKGSVVSIPRGNRPVPSCPRSRCRAAHRRSAGRGPGPCGSGTSPGPACPAEASRWALRLARERHTHTQYLF